MKRLTRPLLMLAAIILTVPIGAAAAEPPSSAAAPGDTCSLLTAEEVGAALGTATPANAMSPDVCMFGDPAESLVALLVARLSGADAAAGLAQARSQAPEIAIAGAPGYQAPTETLDNGLARAQLVVATGEDSLLIMSADAGDGVDVAAAVVALAELAVGRLGPILPPPLASPGASLGPTPSAAAPGAAPSGPPPSMAARTGLAALFPSQVGGEPLTVDVLSGRQFLSRVIGFKPMEQRVTRALRRRDLGIGDLTFAQGTPASQGSVVLAFQVTGGRIAPLVSVLLESLGMERTGDEPRPQDVAGKEGVFEVLSGSEGLAYVSGETLWIVFSAGDEQVEIFGQLP